VTSGIGRKPLEALALSGIGRKPLEALALSGIGRKPLGALALSGIGRKPLGALVLSGIGRTWLLVIRRGKRASQYMQLMRHDVNGSTCPARMSLLRRGHC
jgi:hypothetical protein